MSYDMSILNRESGLVKFKVPDNLATGLNKLLQQVMILLMSDDGELINYVGGQANNQALTPDVLVREAARVTQAIDESTSVDIPDDERLEDLEILKLDESGTYTRINVSVVAVSSAADSVIINL